MPTYLRLQRHNVQNIQVRMPKTSPNTRDNPSRTAPKASSVLPRTEPRDKTLGPTEYPSATVLIKQLWIVFRQDYTSGKAFERDRHATEENFISMHLSLLALLINSLPIQPSRTFRTWPTRRPIT